MSFFKRTIDDCLKFIVVEGEHSNVSSNFLFYFLDFLELNGYDFIVEIYGKCTREFEQSICRYESVKIFGLVDRHVLNRAFERSHLAIFTDNKSAACPNSVLELFSSGIPVIGWNFGAIAEFVFSNKNGFLIDTFDQLEFSKKR